MVDDQLASACHILWTWDDQPLEIVKRQGSQVSTSGGKPADTVVKSSFFQHVHLTGLWLRAQYPGHAGLRHHRDADWRVRGRTSDAPGNGRDAGDAA